MSLLSQKNYVAKTNHSINTPRKERMHAQSHMSINNGVKKFSLGEPRDDRSTAKETNAASCLLGANWCDN